MGTQVSHLGLDLIGTVGLMSLAVAVFCASGLRAVMPSNHDFLESVAWGRFFAGAVYAGLSFLCFWIFFRGLG